MEAYHWIIVISAIIVACWLWLEAHLKKQWTQRLISEGEEASRRAREQHELMMIETTKELIDDLAKTILVEMVSSREAAKHAIIDYRQKNSEAAELKAEQILAIMAYQMAEEFFGYAESRRANTHSSDDPTRPISP